MDASELDLDAKLYKASSTLLSEFQCKLPLLLFHPGATPRRCRARVLDSKCAELVVLLDRFQEWPQLLDACLASIVQLLTDAFLQYLAVSKVQYGPSRFRGTASASSLPRAACRLLCSLCKVRGHKVIVRLLNNEPKYLGLMLSAFQAWDAPTTGMTWEERYIMLLWLSHLMLAPFELANIAIQAEQSHDSPVHREFLDLPGIAGEVTSLALNHLRAAGKEREAASILLVRLSLRKDMQAHNLLSRLVDHASGRLLSVTDSRSLSSYEALGLLSLLYGICNSASDSEIAPHFATCFNTAFQIATDQHNHFLFIRDPAPARKWVLKILRAVLTHAISLSSRDGLLKSHKVDTILEESIQYFLEALGDKDTPVRMAAAKGLSVITLRLEPAMSAEVVEAVLGCLQENVLLEDPHSQKLIPVTDRTSSATLGMKRNISAVDPLRWHGLMLTLAHLLFRRSPPPDMLSEIIQALILGLEFEQRSNVGTSLGVGVRDAACFGLWALARKYSTSELDLVPFTEFAEASTSEYSNCRSVLQLIAVKLVISASLDPSGNIRRGSSAALQELIGRHPDTIVHGIPVVQVVDYHAVARLARAMTEVALQAARLDTVYHMPLLHALIAWRGTRAADVNQRRWAASAVQILTKDLALRDVVPFAEVILGQLINLKPLNIGSTAAARHGLLLGLASTIRSMREGSPQSYLAWLLRDGNPILELRSLTGKIEGRITADVELVMEATTVLVGEVCKSLAGMDHGAPAVQRWLSTAVDVIIHCTVAATRDIVVQSSADAFLEIFRLLSDAKKIIPIDDWLDSERQPPSAFASRGRMKAVSLVHGYFAQQGIHARHRQKIVSYVIGIIEGEYKIETRVDAMEALGVILTRTLASRKAEAPLRFLDVLRHGLTDYTNDQRGDIGSLLRLQTLRTVDSYRNQFGCDEMSVATLRAVMPFVVKLAAEKLNNVRFQAWKCLQSYWQSDSSLPVLHSTWHHSADLASTAYFQQLMQLLSVSWAQKHLILGLISSATSGTEEICRAACTAFLLYIQSLEPALYKELVATTWNIILEELNTKSTPDDRQVVPSLDFICFMIDQDLVSAELLAESGNPLLDVWQIMQNIHTSSSSLQRVEASLNVYARLLSTERYRDRALDKLTRQLLHRWPKIRNNAADFLYLDTPIEALAVSDWNAGFAKQKPIVLCLRKELGVVSHSAPKESQLSGKSIPV